MKLCTLLLLVSTSLWAGEGTITLSVKEALAGATTTFYAVPGQPRVPEALVTLGLPPGTDLSTLAIHLDRPVITHTLGTILPLNPPCYTLDTPPARSPLIAYDTKSLFPTSWVKLQSAGMLGDLPLVTLVIYPERVKGRNHHHLESGEITLTFNVPRSPSHPHYSPLTPSMLPRIYNAQEVSRWIAGRDTPKNLLILTSHFIKTHSRLLETFRDAMAASGWQVAIEEVETFAGDLTGQDRAEAMRSHLQEKWQDGVTHCFIIGDPTPERGDLPMKLVYPHQDLYAESVPTDLYYADLSGNWDLNGDGRPGTFIVDGGPGGVDFLPEIIVGRLPVYNNTIEQVDGYLRRLLRFKSIPHPLDRTFLLPDSIPFLPNEYGEGEAMTDGAELGEELSAFILDPLGIPYLKLYETEGISPSPHTCDFPITEANVVGAWSMGAGGVLWYGHGGSQAVVRTIWDHDDGDGRPEYDNGEIVQKVFYQSGDVWDLEPGFPSFAFAVACNNGTPEDENNLAASMMRTGCIGAMGATRSAAVFGSETDFVEHGSASGIGYRTMMNLVQGMDAGSALLLAKGDPDVDKTVWDYWWQNIYDYNLYGDPTALYTGGTLSETFPEPDLYWIRANPAWITECPEEITFTLKGSGPDLKITTPGSGNNGLPALSLPSFTILDSSYEGDGRYTLHAKVTGQILGPGTHDIPITLGSTTGRVRIDTLPETLTDPAGNYTGDPQITCVDILESGTTLEGDTIRFSLKVASPFLPPSFFQGDDEFFAAAWFLDTNMDGGIDTSLRYYMYQAEEYAILVTEPDNAVLDYPAFQREGNSLIVNLPIQDLSPDSTALGWILGVYAFFDNAWGTNYQEMDDWGGICFDQPPTFKKQK